MAHQPSMAKPSHVPHNRLTAALEWPRTPEGGVPSCSTKLQRALLPSHVLLQSGAYYCDEVVVSEAIVTETNIDILMEYVIPCDPAGCIHQEHVLITTSMSGTQMRSNKSKT